LGAALLGGTLASLDIREAAADPPGCTRNGKDRSVAALTNCPYCRRGVLILQTADGGLRIAAQQVGIIGADAACCLQLIDLDPKRKKSAAAVPRSSGEVFSRLCVATMSPSAMARLMSRLIWGNCSTKFVTN